MSSLVTLNKKPLIGREIQIGNNGEILVKGPPLFQGYLGEKKQEDWFATGDLGDFQDGKLTIIGRKDWMFISGGENIQPEEIEQELLMFSDILEAVVIPKNDPEFGKRPVAFLKVLTQINIRQIQTTLQNRLPKYKIPISFHILDEIPKINGFKINRFILSQIANYQLDEKNSGQKKPAYL